MTRPLRTAPARAALAVGTLLLAAGPATAASASPTGTTPTDGARIAHVQGGEGSLQLLVDVPAGVGAVDGVEVTVAGEPAEATAESASGTTQVARTAILVVDLSNSMQGGRIEAARAAAETFLDTVPSDVEVGMVGFSSDVATLVEPTRDREAALSALEEAPLAQGTRLHDGVVAAAALAGTEGQRSLVVLSDGADTSTTPLQPAVDAITAAGLVVDVVAIDPEAGTAAGLEQLAAAGGGSVVPADPEALEAALGQEAEVLANQVLVDVALPAALVESGTTEGPVAVTLDTATGPLSVEAFSSFADALADAGAASPTAATAPAPSASAGAGTPAWLGWLGPVVLGLGLVAVLVLLVPRPQGATDVSERVSAYTRTRSLAGGVGGAVAKVEPEQALAQAKEAAEGLLERNRSLQDRISKRLDGAGSDLRPAEWLLVHGAIFIGAGLLGLLLGGGSVLLGLLGMAAGLLGPWVYLGIRRSRRRKAFGRALPDTLQLMSGSLAAGLSLAQSVDTIVREGPQPIAGEFKRVLVETRLGVSLEDALDGVSERFDSKDFEWVVMAIRIQRQVGGNLAELLDTVAATMREREYIRRQVAALAAEGKLSAIVLGGLPPAFLLYLLVSNRDYVMVLFTEPLGWAMLAGGSMLLGLGIFWMSRLIKVEI